MNNKQTITSKEWRMNNLYWIIDRNQKKIKFRMNKAQAHFNKHKAKRNIILKSRRLGFTTYECIDMLDDALFTPNFEGILIAHKKEKAEEIFDKIIQYCWRNIRQEIKDRLWTVDMDRASKLKFNYTTGENGAISVSSSGRSGTFNRVHISEYAPLCKLFPQRAIEVITGTIPAVPPEGRVDIESTAEGEDNEFADMFWDAYDRGEPKFPTQYKSHFYNWLWDIEELNKITDKQIKEFINSQNYDKYYTDFKQSFKDYQTKNKLTDKEITYYYTKWLSLNKKFLKLFTEFPFSPEEAFATSGNKLFIKEAIERQKIHEKEGEKVGHWIYYEDYKANHIYAGGADVSHGVGRDSSTIVIIDFTQQTPRVVAEYANNEIDATVFAHEVKNGGTRYGNCLMAVENNDRGYATCVELGKIYSNIYKHKIEGGAEIRETTEYGWRTTGATKPKMILELKTAYNEDELIVPSQRINREARGYDENDLNVIRFDENTTKHYDLIIATAICWQMRTNITYQSSDGGLGTGTNKKANYE